MEDEFKRFDERIAQAEYRLLGTEIDFERPRGHLTITRSDDGEIRWDNLYHILSQTNELLIATNSLIYAVADQTDCDLVKSICFCNGQGYVERLTTCSIQFTLPPPALSAPTPSASHRFAQANR